MSNGASTGSSGGEHLEIVRSSDRLAAIAPAWESLWQRLDGLIFQSPAWTMAWWETVPDRDRRELRVGLIWIDEKLAAVMPLAIGRRKGLRFLEWAANSFTDYGDILIAPECPASALQRLWMQISASGGFDLVYLNRLLPEAAARRLFGPGASGGVRLHPNHRSEESYRVAGPWANGAAWFAAKSKKARKSYRYGINVLRETGEVRFRLLSADEPLEPVLQRLSVLKRAWLAERDRESVLFDEETRTLAALVDVLARAGVLHVFVLECEGVMIAVSINFVQHGTMMAFVTTYDPEFGRASPGMLLMMDYIRWSFDHGLTMVDFLCGGEAFKQRFATGSVTLESVLGIRTMRGSLASVADRARQSIRAMRDRRRPAAAPIGEAEVGLAD
jgi:CelD/BcsL family acetyltransferase involved in cellulose biosynthesis